MKLSITILATLLLTSPVSAERKLKPTVCQSWQLYRSERGSELAVCQDEGKRYLMGRAKVVELEGPEGAERVLVGYRGIE